MQRLIIEPYKAILYMCRNLNSLKCYCVRDPHIYCCLESTFAFNHEETSYLLAKLIVCFWIHWMVSGFQFISRLSIYIWFIRLTPRLKAISHAFQYILCLKIDLKIDFYLILILYHCIFICNKTINIFSFLSIILISF